MSPSLNGRHFRSVDQVRAGDVGADTLFEYFEDDDLVHARYSGGNIRLGFLVGSRDGDELDFRYAQARVDGTTATGHCHSRITTLPDGRLRLEQTWEWESRPGQGTSAVEEAPT